MKTHWFLAAVLLTSVGCTAGQLRHSTVRQVTTLTDVQQAIVLDNLAAFSCDIDTIPFQANLNSGTTQVVDSGAVLSQVLGSATLGFGLSRGIVDQWGMTPVTDETALRLLRIAYRRAMGYDDDVYTNDFANRLAHRLKGQLNFGGDIGQANTVMFARGPALPQVLDRAGWKGDTEVGFKVDDLAVKRWKKDTTDLISTGSDRIVQVGERLSKDTLNVTPLLEDGVPVVLPGEEDPRVLIATPYAAEVRRQVYELNKFLVEIDPGWVQVADKKHDIPVCACFIGMHKDCGCQCWIWVHPDDEAAFQDFVLRTMRLASLFQQPEFGGQQGAVFSPVPAAAF
jgi:hypothetical protein